MRESEVEELGDILDGLIDTVIEEAERPKAVLVTDVLSNFDMSSISDFRHLLHDMYPVRDSLLYTKTTPYGGVDLIFKFNTKAEHKKAEEERIEMYKKRGITKVEPIRLVRPKNEIIINDIERLCKDEMWTDIKTQIDNDIQPYLI